MIDQMISQLYGNVIKDPDYHRAKLRERRVSDRGKLWRRFIGD